jgi:hypothetical protein
MIDQDKQSPEAESRSVCHTDSECAQMYADLDDGLKAPALAMLKRELSPVYGQIKDAYKFDPSGWYIGYHFGWGMAVRNLLRQKGFGEEYFHIHNLDDIYVKLVEEALELG